MSALNNVRIHILRNSNGKEIKRFSTDISLLPGIDDDGKNNTIMSLVRYDNKFYILCIISADEYTYEEVGVLNYNEIDDDHTVQRKKRKNEDIGEY